MINLKFYHLLKRINSTRQPLEQELLFSEEVVLKGATDFDNPVFILSNSNTPIETMMEANYVQWGTRYFWIDRKIYLNASMIEFDCRIDALASYKDMILQHRCLVERSSSEYDVHIPDPLIATKNSITYDFSAESLTDIFSDSPLIIIEVANKIGSSFDTPYVITPTECELLKNELYDPNLLQTFSQWFSNPLECVIRAQVSAWNCGDLGNVGPYEDIYIGDYLTSVKGRRSTTNKYVTTSKIIRIPWIYNDFRKITPYTQLMLYLPFVGVVNLDTSLLAESEHIRIECTLEVITGNIVYMVQFEYGEGYNKFAMFNGNCNAFIPIGQMKPADPIQMIPAASMVAGGLAGKQSGLVALGISNFAGAMQQHSMINGTISSFISSKLPLSAQLICVASDSAVEPIDIVSEFGLPCYQELRLSSLSGYCKCVSASVKLTEDLETINEVNNYLNGGFYIE